MLFPVFLDTCALYPGLVADVLLRIAESGAYAPHWSPQVLEEMRRNLAKLSRVGEDGARRRLDAMQTAFPRASVTGYQGLTGVLTCAEEDRHVLAAAAYAKCQVLVTYNVRDFPDTAAAPHGVTVVNPDQFLLDQLELHPVWTVRSLRDVARESRRPLLSPSAVLDSLSRSGLSGFAPEVIRRYPFATWEVI